MSIVSIADARRIMREALKDKDLELAYVSNIAMLLHDRYGICEMKMRNQAAKDILNLIFN